MARRVRFFDSLRGLSVLSMVGFHLCYDLRYLAGLSLPWFQGTFQDIWRATISWVFLFLAGVMSSYSRNNYRRAAKYALFALVIFAVTAIAAVDDAISFGIIFCMAACTLVTAILETLRIRPGGLLAGAACVAAFLALLHVPSGTSTLVSRGWPYHKSSMRPLGSLGLGSQVRDLFRATTTRFSPTCSCTLLAPAQAPR